MVPWQIAREISQHLHIPTIGIGAGSGCDGQVLVAQDMLGFSNSKKFKFVKQYANIWKTMVDAAEAYIHDVKTLSFPTTDNSFNISETEYSEFLHLISQDLKILSRKKIKMKKVLNQIVVLSVKFMEIRTNQDLAQSGRKAKYLCGNLWLGISTGLG